MSFKLLLSSEFEAVVRLCATAVLDNWYVSVRRSLWIYKKLDG